MLIGGSEVLGAIQISQALLKYPSVPLPVLSNPLIPPDWRRGGEYSCWLLPPSRGPWLCEGGGGGGLWPLFPWLGAGLPGPCHVLYIRGDQQASLKVRWHQEHAQCSLTTPTPPALPPPFIFHHPQYHLLPFLLTVTCSSHSLTNLRHPYRPPPSFISPVFLTPLTHITLTLPWDGSEKATCRMLECG